MEDLGNVFFRLRKPGNDRRVDLIHADVRIEGATIFIAFSLASEGWPFTIKNESDHFVEFCQQVGLALYGAVHSVHTSVSGCG